MIDQYHTILCKGRKTQRYWQMAGKTYEECLAALRKDGKALKCVPEELKTVELCLAALKRDGWALEYVPEELRDQVKKAVGIK